MYNAVLHVILRLPGLVLFAGLRFIIQHEVVPVRVCQEQLLSQSVHHTLFNSRYTREVEPRVQLGRPD